MTQEEIKELARIEGEYRFKASNLIKYDDVMECLQYAKAAAVIDYIRKDLKKIVADAVKEAVGTLNSDRKPVYPDDTALHDFLKLHLLNYKPKELFPIDETGKHPIASNSYEGQYRYRAKLSVMGIAYFEEIQGYLTNYPIGEPYQLLVNGKWVECPKNFTAYDFTGLSEDMKLLGLDFQSSPMKALDEAWKKREATESKRHHIDDVKFTFSDTRELLDSFGVNYLDEIKGYNYGLNKYDTVIYIFDQIRFIPKKNFADLKAVMMSYCVPFLPMDIINGEKKKKKHSLGDVKFKNCETYEVLKSFGVKNLEEIQGYKQNHRVGIFSILFDEDWKAIPAMCFSDLEEVMKANDVPFWNMTIRIQDNEQSDSEDS